MYKDKAAAGLLMGGEEYEDWMAKDLSTCVLSGDHECAIVQGKVTNMHMQLSVIIWLE